MRRYSIESSITFRPPASRIALVEKLVCAPVDVFEEGRNGISKLGGDNCKFQFGIIRIGYGSRIRTNPRRISVELTGTVPVAAYQLRIEGNADMEIFCDTLQKESRHPGIVTGRNTDRWTDLELPLRRHHLCVFT